MSPRAPDPAVRRALIEAAAKLIADEGLAGLTLRRLATAVGTSTMAIYTHFGSMEEVRRAVGREGFLRLAHLYDEVNDSDDPASDLLLLGMAYFENAVTNPNLYRVMFMFDSDEILHFEERSATFRKVTGAIERCHVAGRFGDVDPPDAATQLWSVQHGALGLYFAGTLSERQAFHTFRVVTGHLFVAFGDDPDAASRSWASARRRSPSTARRNARAGVSPT